MKTHCPKGHPYDDENTYFRPDGSYYCCACNYERVQKVRREGIPSPHSLGEQLAMFMSKTEFTDEVPDVPDPPKGGCLLWTASKYPSGYGRFGHSRPPGPPTTRAHRWIYQFVHGLLDTKTDLDHLCGVKHCVAPWHLDPVGRKEHVARTRERQLWREQRVLS